MSVTCSDIFQGKPAQENQAMNDRAKQLAAERAIEQVQDGQVVGLGTGSTAKFAIEGLARRVCEGLSIRGVPTPIATERMATQLGIWLVPLNDAGAIDVTFDGADEVDPAFNMIKGGGGALTREKLVAISANFRINIVDEQKMVSKLGKGFAVPVEVLPFAWSLSSRWLQELNCQPKLRKKDGKIFATDNDN